MKDLTRVEFGNPLLRAQAEPLTKQEIASSKIQTLIQRMRQTLTTKKLGVGLAAPQVGQGIALSVICVRPTAHRSHVEPFDAVIINPKIKKTHGKQSLMWEGCLSAGASGLFAKVPRYKEVEVEYTDENGDLKHLRCEGLVAQIMQHEIDHLNGILFVDHVKDPTTFMTLKEYKKRIVHKR